MWWWNVEVEEVVESGCGRGGWQRRWWKWLVEAVETEEAAAVGEGGWVLAAVAQGGSGGQLAAAAAVG